MSLHFTSIAVASYKSCTGMLKAIGVLFKLTRIILYILVVLKT